MVGAFNFKLIPPTIVNGITTVEKIFNGNQIAILINKIILPGEISLFPNVAWKNIYQFIKNQRYHLKR